MIELLDLPGVGQWLAQRILREWPKEAERDVMLRERPYELARIEGIGFAKADTIALHLGLSPQAPIRAQAASLHVLREAAQREGHTRLPYAELVARAGEYGLMPAQHNDIVNCNGDDVSYKPYFKAEEYIAERVAQMIDAAPWSAVVETEDLAEDQQGALNIILRQRFSVLLGAAGTGKTTLLQTLLHNLDRAGQTYAMAAPTGKAAKRMEQATGVPARTIHRLLEAAHDYENNRFFFERNENNTLDEDWIIIDEASMIDVHLMQSLLRAIPKHHTRLLLVGDPWQLPSVGPGDVLRDLTNGHGLLPHVVLSTLKRQDPRLLLAANCQRVRQGEMVHIDNEIAEDFFFADERDGAQIISEIVSIVAKRGPARWNVKPSDIQVITALRERGDVSCAELNAALRAELNPNAAEIIKGFAPGDRVIQTKNDYRLGVMNGELGIVQKVERGLKVKFDGIDSIVKIPPGQQRLELAWCITCHRAQGSEWDVVVIPIHKSSGALVPRRRWMYTALSRGKRATILVGNYDELQRTIARTQDTMRWTNLGRFLSEAAKAANSAAGGQS